MPQIRTDLPFNLLKKHKALREAVTSSKLKFVNMEIKTFHFNPLMVNTYILSDETREAVIVDPGNCRFYEDGQIREYVADNHLDIKETMNEADIHFLMDEDDMRPYKHLMRHMRTATRIRNEKIRRKLLEEAADQE